MRPSEMPPTMSPEALNFRMPKCPVGTTVLWYRNGIRDRSVVEVAYMVHAGERTATVLSCTGRRIDAVRHCDDPKLQLSPEQRENGSWDFTEEYLRVRALEERIRKMELRVSQIPDPQAITHVRQALTTKQSKKPKRPAPAHLARYRELRAQAATQGIEVPHNINLEDLAKLIESKASEMTN